MTSFLRTAALLSFAAVAATAADFPQAQISNGLVKATVYLPDAKAGYYQATRFDWSGLVTDLEYKGHTYFGDWTGRPWDPKKHDTVTGPAEEFSEFNAPGYAAAPVGGTFLKIGVGMLKKPQEEKYNHFGVYEIVDTGKWTVKTAPDSVTFIHVVHDKATGWAYEYRKIVRLEKGKPTLSIEHRLKNIGRNTIQTDVYEHNFYMLDKKPTGPNLSIKFPFDIKVDRPWQAGTAENRGKEIVYLKELGARETASNEISGFTVDPNDYNFTIENKETGAGVRQTADRPISRINFWSIRNTSCPEAYIALSILPGKEFSWRINWDFYTTK